MTLLKSLAAILSSPLLMAVILACTGLVLLRRHRRRAGKWLIAAGGTLAYLASTSLVGNALIAPLESQYPPFDAAQAAGVHDIVVLGSGYEPRDGFPVTSALDADGLARIVEGVRLARAIPNARLLVSGGARPGFARPAAGYAQMAAELGVQPSALVVMDHALNTAQEARDVTALLGHAPFILVTSAYHMPRAMRLMLRAGARPVPAATGQLLRVLHPADRFGVFPGSHGLHKTETALHEYWGLAAAALHIDR
jgi:uncharacterized SAM-binding protein YcdF (DUF218 family)